MENCVEPKTGILMKHYLRPARPLTEVNRRLPKRVKSNEFG